MLTLKMHRCVLPPRFMSAFNSPYRHHSYGVSAQFDSIRPLLAALHIPTYSPTSTFSKVCFSQKKRRTALSIKEKIALVLAAISEEVNWSLSEFLFHVFVKKDSSGKEIHRSQSHANTSVQKILSGHCKYLPAQIFQFWWLV